MAVDWSGRGLAGLPEELFSRDAAPLVLNLANNQLTTSVIAQLEQLVSTSLVHLDLSCNPMHASFFDFFPPFRTLAASIAHQDCRLQLLALESVQIDHKNLAALADGLAVNRSLVQLRLGSNDLNEKDSTLLADIIANSGML